MLDTTTGEVLSVTLKHEGNNVREFYSTLAGPVRVGIEATGSMQWFVNLMEELGIECLVGDPAEIWAAFEGATGSAVLVEAPSSMGTHAHANTECAAVDSLGEWSTTRPLLVEPRRTKHDRVIAARATHRLSAE
jgi:hypothetical protein